MRSVIRREKSTFFVFCLHSMGLKIKEISRQWKLEVANKQRYTISPEVNDANSILCLKLHGLVGVLLGVGNPSRKMFSIT